MQLVFFVFASLFSYSFTIHGRICKRLWVPGRNSLCFSPVTSGFTGLDRGMGWNGHTIAHLYYRTYWRIATPMGVY